MNLSIIEQKPIQVPQPDDIMITKECSSCGIDVLLRKDEYTCMNCKEIKGIV